MFGLFGKATAIKKLEKKYKKTLEESYILSHTNRSASDHKRVEAEKILEKIESLRAQ